MNKMSEPISSTVYATVSSVSNKVTVAGGSAAVAGYFTTTEWLALGGFVIALLGFILQAISTYRKDQREEEEHALRVKRLLEHDNDE